MFFCSALSASTEICNARTHLQINPYIPTVSIYQHIYGNALSASTYNLNNFCNALTHLQTKNL